ncbi:MAG: hypothetical protein LBC18_11145 [Opitutaceae bacterium]|nr:hypothetical protein [Opitutaceae bacterium]
MFPPATTTPSPTTTPSDHSATPPLRHSANPPATAKPAGTAVPPKKFAVRNP